MHVAWSEWCLLFKIAESQSAKSSFLQMCLVMASYPGLCKKPYSVYKSTSSLCASKRRSEYCLEKYFKFSSFHPGQLDAILPILHGKDVFVRMATGSGKSLCMLVRAIFFLLYS